MPDLDWTQQYEDDPRMAESEEARRERLLAEARQDRDRRRAETRATNLALRSGLIATVAQRIRETCSALAATSAPQIELYPSAGLLKPRILGWKPGGYSMLPDGTICYGTRKQLTKMTPEEFGAFLLPNVLSGRNDNGGTSESMIDKAPDWYKCWAEATIDAFSLALAKFLRDKA
jgi:hypothetical protein